MTVAPPLRLPMRSLAAHKGDFGRALLVGGSRGMSGSIALSAIAALHTGSGLVTAVVPDRCLETVASFHAAVMTIPLPDDQQGRFSVAAASGLSRLLKMPVAVGCGPGMTTQPGSLRIVERVLQARTIPRVLDADAINSLALIDWFSSSEDVGPLVLTPHPGEFARLSGIAPAEREAQLDGASDLASRTGAVIVLKGGPTVVVGHSEAGHSAPGHSAAGQLTAWVNTTGNPGMATAGSGDVLTGMITSLLGQGLSAWDAARLGVWIHGRAGDIAADQLGQPGMTAPAISAAIPQVVTSLSEEA